MTRSCERLENTYQRLWRNALQPLTHHPLLILLRRLAARSRRLSEKSEREPGVGSRSDLSLSPGFTSSSSRRRGFGLFTSGSILILYGLTLKAVVNYTAVV